MENDSRPQTGYSLERTFGNSQIHNGVKAEMKGLIKMMLTP